MKFYKTPDDKLYQYNPETKVYKLMNIIEQVDKRISEEDFNKLETTTIKREEFSRLMNIYFKNVEHTWQFGNKTFRKMPNFEEDTYSLSDNYQLGKEVPYHDLNEIGRDDYYMKNLVMVYHWGRIYYHTVSYNGYAQGQLVTTDDKHEYVRWARLRNCAPIFCVDDKKIC